MKIELELKDDVTHRWWLVARFEYGAHAMEAARALSEHGGLFRVVDPRWNEELPMKIVYEDGVAS